MVQWLNKRRKAIAMTLTAVLTAVNLWVPDYSGEAKKIIASVILVLGIAGVHGIRNLRPDGTPVR